MAITTEIKPKGSTLVNSYHFSQIIHELRACIIFVCYAVFKALMDE